MSEQKQPAEVGPVELVLGPLPPTAYVLARESDGYSPDRLLSEAGYTEEQMRAYAAQEVAAERERCASIVCDMDYLPSAEIARLIRSGLNTQMTSTQVPVQRNG